MTDQLPDIEGSGGYARESQPVVVVDRSGNLLQPGGSYEAVAASTTDQALGADGADGDMLTGLLIVPASTSPGAVTVKDGDGAAMTIFAGGTDSVSTLHPFFAQLGARSTLGGWQVTTGADVSVIAVGDFS